MNNEDLQLLHVVTGIHKKKSSEWSLREEQKVYMFHFTHVECATEQILKECIRRYNSRLSNRWLILLLSEYPTEINYDLFCRCSVQSRGGKMYKKVLNCVIGLPHVSIEALKLILRKLHPAVQKRSRTEMKLYGKAVQRLAERERDSLTYEI